MNKKIVIVFVMLLLTVGLLSGCTTKIKTGYEVNGYISDINIEDLNGMPYAYEFTIDNRSVRLYYDEQYTDDYINLNYRGNATIEYLKETDFGTKNILTNMIEKP